MDGPKLELNSKPFVDAIKPALEALADLRAAVQALDNTTVKNLKANVQSAKTQLTSAVSGIEETLTKLPQAIEKTVAGSAGKAREAGRKVGRAVGDGAVSETLNTVRAARQRMQNEYEQWFNRGGKVKPEALLNLRTQGVQLFPEDISRLVAYRKAVKEIKQQGDLQTNLRAAFAAKAAGSATPLDPRTILGLTPDILRKSAAASADVFKQAFTEEASKTKLRAASATAIDPRVLLGLPPEVMRKSAAASADVFKQAFADQSNQTKLRAASATAIDPRVLLGLTPNVMGKSAAASADVFKQAFAEEASKTKLRAASATAIDPRVLLGLTPEVMRKSAAASADVFKQAFEAETSRVKFIDKNAAFEAMSPRGQLSRATRVASALGSGMPEAEALKRYGSAAIDASKNLASLQQQVNTLSTAKQGLLERSRDVHSAFRGIAGAAGALFLTYGALLPLTTAFFASTAVKRAVSEFAAMEFQLRFVQAAAEDYTISVESMTASTIRMAAESGKAPIEAAKGLRLLAQSGLSTSQALQALPGIMRTATIGELDMADAATTLTGAMFAFGLNIADIERIGDVFAKAGALSNTSVSQISESMKQASSVAQEYKLSVEDVTTTLVALARRNITGSAAGTAVRNMYKDLAAPRGAGKEVAKLLGVSLFGKDGQIKDMFTQYVPELRKALDGLTHEAQVYALDRIANERGGKALSALLGMSSEDLQNIRTQLKQAEGFTRDAVETLNDTLQRDYDRLKSTLSASFIEAGSASATGMRSAVQTLTDVVASPEFIGAITSLTKIATGTAQAFSVLAQAVMSPAAQLTALSVALVAGRGAFAGLGAALLGTTAAAGAATTAFMLLSKAFVGFAVVSGVVTLLGLLYDKLNEKDAYATTIDRVNKAIETQRDYNKELQETINKQREAAGGKTTTGQELLRARAQAKQELDEAKAQLDAYTARQAAGGTLYKPAMPPGLVKRAQEAQSKYDELFNKSVEFYFERSEGQRLKAEAAAGSRTNNTPSLGGGGDSLDVRDPEAEAAARRAQSEASKLYQNALRPSQNLKAQFDNANRQVDAQTKLDEARLQGVYDKGLLSYEDFETSRDVLQRNARDARMTSLAAEVSQTEQEIQKIRDAAARAEKIAPGAVSSEQVESDVERLQNQIRAARQEVQQLTNDQEVADIASSTRRAKGIVDATKSAADLLLMSKLDAENQAEASGFRKELLLMSEVGAVRAQAEREVQEKFLKEELRLRAEIEKYKDADPEVSRNARKQLDELRGKDPKNLAVQAGERAVQEFRATKIAETARELKSGLADAFIEGGETGAEMLRNTLQDVFIKRPLKLMLEAVFDPFAKAASAGLNMFLGNVLGLRAGGGPVSAGNRYLVGENGPEIVEFGQSGRVYNTNESRQMMSGPSGTGGTVLQVTVSPTIHIDSRSDKGQVQQLVAAGVKEGNRQMAEQLKTLGVIR